ncbi:MAG: hypothetical protein ACFFCS_28080 [Candidatus Hodarchaeota archaeon]
MCIQPAVLNRPSDSSAKGRQVNQALRTRSNVNRESVGIGGGAHVSLDAGVLLFLPK